MKSILSSLAIPLITTATMLGSTAIFPRLALADKNDIDLADAPNAVQETILDAAAQGVLDDVELTLYQGQAVYVAEIDLPGKRDLEVFVAADGRLLRSEEEVAWAALPAPVQATLQSQAGRTGKVEDLSRVTVGKTVTYSAEIEIRDQRFKGETEVDVEIAATGKLLSAVERHDD